MGIKQRLILLNFLQFFIWGSWLLTIGAYWFQTKHWSGTEFGAIFSTMGIASLFMPAITGFIADRWINAEKLYGIFHILGGIVLFMVPKVNNPSAMFWIMLLNMVFYMPTISLAITVGYTVLKSKGKDIITEYPPIRVWGTIGFIVASGPLVFPTWRYPVHNSMSPLQRLFFWDSTRLHCPNAHHWGKPKTNLS